MKKNKTIYIAGKVTGEDLAKCTMKFGEAQVKIEALGYEVINPLQLISDIHTPWQLAMRMCISKLMTCHAVYVLEDAKRSRGAKIEMELARGIEIPLLVNFKEFEKWSNLQPTP